MKAWTETKMTSGRTVKKVRLDDKAAKQLSHKLLKRCGKYLPAREADELLRQVKADLNIR